MMQYIVLVFSLVFTSIFILSEAAHAQKNNDENRLLLKNAYIYKPEGAFTEMPSHLLVQDGMILEIISEGNAIPKNIEVKDLAGRYVLPGLIDVHAHPRSLDAYQETLRSGVTTIRTMGVGGYGDVTLRELVRSGRLAGPEVFAAGVYVQPKINRDAVLWEPRLARFAENKIWDQDSLRKFVNINIDRGVDWIKTRGTERAGLAETDPRLQVYSKANIGTIVKTAEERSVKVAVHAHGDAGIRAALEAGVQTIEHGTFASEETISLMSRLNVYLVPTISVTDKNPPAHPKLLIRSSHMLPEVRLIAARAHAAGVTILPGTDSSYSASESGSENFIYNKRIGHELSEFVKIGLAPKEAIRSATEAAADMLGIADRVGRLEKGYEADLIVLNKNPLEKIYRVLDPIMVISNGHVVVNRIQ